MRSTMYRFPINFVSFINILIARAKRQMTMSSQEIDNNRVTSKHPLLVKMSRFRFTRFSEIPTGKKKKKVNYKLN